MRKMAEKMCNIVHFIKPSYRIKLYLCAIVFLWF